MPWLKSKRTARFITLLTSVPPNTTKEKIHFRGSLKNSLQTLDDNNIIVVGDSNTVTNNSIDNISRLPHADSEVLTFREIVAFLDLNGTWRTQHPQEKKEKKMVKTESVHSKETRLRICDATTISKTKETKI